MKTRKRDNKLFIIVSILLVVAFIVAVVAIIQNTQGEKYINNKNNPKINALVATIDASSYKRFQGNTDTWEPQGYNVCWAYAMCKSIEANIFVKTNQNINLDENYLISKYASADTLYAGNGAYIKDVYNFYLAHSGNGITDEASQHYVSVNNMNYLGNNPTVRDIKEHIVEHGGVVTTIWWANNPYKQHVTADPSGIETYAMATPSGVEMTSAHAVTILGWNDNYSKQNFPASSNVKNDGAFWAYNPARAGVLWISYEDFYLPLHTYSFDTSIASYTRSTTYYKSYR